VEELPNGSVLLVTWPTAADFAIDEARLAQARAHAHLRPDLDFDTVLHALRERSAALAPVAPHFPPDLAPLLSRVVDRTAIHERQRKIAELNAWRPPEPTEWLPVDEALPSEVGTPEHTLDQYSLQAEHLVAMLHAEVPSISKRTRKSLTDVDFYFWRDDSPKRRLGEVLDEHVVPAIGAYLGRAGADPGRAVDTPSAAHGGTGARRRSRLAAIRPGPPLPALPPVAAGLLPHAATARRSATAPLSERKWRTSQGPPEKDRAQCRETYR
jgi:hypothetical protein